MTVISLLDFGLNFNAKAAPKNAPVTHEEIKITFIP
jgi:hypothetical protein